MQILEKLTDREIVAITVKGLGNDDNGLQQYVWATKKQLERLLEAQFDEIERNFVFQLGDRGIRPCDILTFKIMKLEKAQELPAFRPYILDVLKSEDETNNKLNSCNKFKTLGA